MMRNYLIYWFYQVDIFRNQSLKNKGFSLRGPDVPGEPIRAVCEDFHTLIPGRLGAFVRLMALWHLRS